MSPEPSSQKQTDPSQDRDQLFLEMVEKYQDAIFRFLFFRVGTRSVAVDIAQDTFTKTWAYLASGKTIDYPEAFLYRTAKNALIDYYKKEKSGSLDTLIDAGFDPGTNRDTDEILRNDDIAGVRALLETLDEDSRQIIHLRFAEEKPIEEIAAIYGKSVNAMTVSIHRIVKKLRAKHEQEHGT